MNGVETMANSHGRDGRDLAYPAALEIAALAEDAAQIVPDLLANLRSRQSDVVSCDPLLLLGAIRA